MKKIRIGNSLIGDGFPCYFVAEIGTGYRTFEEAKTLIDSAIEVGINAVKFQTFEAETITTKKNFINTEETGRISQFELFKKLEIPKEIQLKIVNYAQEKGITIFSAPSHIMDLITLKELDLQVYKIGSDLACHIPLLKEVAKLQKPIILSTGMCTMNEVKEAVEAIKSEGNDQIAILHCVSDYPAKIEDSNLNAIITMKEEFQLPIGFSDHSIGITIPFAAATLGANIIEKHFRSPHNAPSPDDIHSINQKEFSELINSVRLIEKAKGNGKKYPTKSEVKNKETNRVSIIVMSDIKKGQIITKDVLDIRRPGTGISPKNIDKIIGKQSKRDIFKDEPLKLDDLE